MNINEKNMINIVKYITLLKQVYIETKFRK